ncbi:hypothetical protein TGDOM2_399880, partial [Toxoplasma gondii GAB2-2007-GAL-DOM2]
EWHRVKLRQTSSRALCFCTARNLLKAKSGETRRRWGGVAARGRPRKQMWSELKLRRAVSRKAGSTTVLRHPAAVGAFEEAFLSFPFFSSPLSFFARASATRSERQSPPVSQEI